MPATARGGRAGLALAAGTSLVVACCLSPSGPTGARGALATILFTAGLAAWAAGLTALGLIDSKTLLLPTKPVRSTGLLILTAVFLTSCMTGDWSALWGGVICAAIAFLSFGVWAVVAGDAIGFGDVRFATVVAFGAGAISPSLCLTAVAGAVLAGGVASRLGHKGLDRPHPVPLGPFLAAAGITCVVASAN